ncbi:MAG: hypothetical protein K6T29_00335 [Peptococcaceae bacterium]|nr:hypothetical protein [Peptococcaceae bacterium]
MGILAGRRGITYPQTRYNEKEKTGKKRPDSYMEQLTKIFLANFRAFIEAANQS